MRSITRSESDSQVDSLTIGERLDNVRLLKSEAGSNLKDVK